MLDRLEDAFAAREASQERLRRFIADASHELRTPLVSIRGYAELFRMGAAREPEDVAKAMRRIEDEAARMGVLVEDLLTLARLDEVREAPHGAVDLSVLARDAVDDARATAPEREITLDAAPAGGDRRRRSAAPGARQPAPQRARPHARGHADRGLRDARERRRAAAGARPRPRPAERRRRRALRALLARRGRAASAARTAPGSGWRSWPGSSTVTPARCQPRTRRAAAPPSRFVFPPAQGLRNAIAATQWDFARVPAPCPCPCRPATGSGGRIDQLPHPAPAREPDLCVPSWPVRSS